MMLGQAVQDGHGLGAAAVVLVLVGCATFDPRFKEVDVKPDALAAYIRNAPALVPGSGMPGSIGSAGVPPRPVPPGLVPPGAFGDGSGGKLGDQSLGSP